MQQALGHGVERRLKTVMGFQDRDYYREESAATGIQSMVVKLIILNAVLFLADMFFGGHNHKITGWLALKGDAVAHPWMWYQFVTAGFVHDWRNLWHIVGNMLGLYVFGRPLEERYGPLEFLRLFLTAIVLGYVVWGVRSYFFVGPQPVMTSVGPQLEWASCLGASGGVTATIILFCLLYPRATLLLFFAIPMPAWLFGVLLVASDIFGTNLPGPGNRVAYDVHLVGASFALCYWYFRWNFGRLPGLARMRKVLATPQKWLASRPQLGIHDPEQYYDDLDEEADRILAKLGREGEASLTPQERRVLEDYSRRMRQKLR